VGFEILTSFVHLLEEGDGKIDIATTRPETMLGDLAVAVHPEGFR
jgi:valyl-tRNA synthetase